MSTRFAISSLVSIISLALASSALTGCFVAPSSADGELSAAPGHAVTAGGDTDSDGVADDIDVCPGYDDLGDNDGDGVLARNDVCEGGDDRLDADEDGVPDPCDRCVGDDASGDSDDDGICDRAYTGGGYACATRHFSDKGWCMWDCDTEASEAMSAGTCFGHDPNLQGCCYECVNDCVKLEKPVPDCAKGGSVGAGGAGSGTEAGTSTGTAHPVCVAQFEYLSQNCTSEPLDPTAVCKQLDTLATDSGCESQYDALYACLNSHQNEWTCGGAICQDAAKAAADCVAPYCNQVPEPAACKRPF